MYYLPQPLECLLVSVLSDNLSYDVIYRFYFLTWIGRHVREFPGFFPENKRQA